MKIETILHAREQNLKSAVLSGVLTLCLFLMIPIIDLLTPSMENLYVLRTVASTIVPLPIPDPPEVERKVQKSREMPQPQLVTSQNKLPVRAVLDLDFSLEKVPGDFEMNFKIAKANLIVQLQKYIFEVSEIDDAPRPLTRLSPLYPPRARMRKVEGEVRVEFIVTVDGKVSEPEITYTYPMGIFDSATLQAVKRWTFKPGIKNGQPVSVRVRQTLKFQLEK